MCLAYGQACAGEEESLKAARILEAQGKSFLKKGDLRSAANALMAASRLHPRPATLMRLVSLYADLGRAQDKKNANCEDVNEALGIFFQRCDVCRKSTEKSCRVCRFVESTSDAHLGQRAYNLSQSFEKESREAALKAAQTPGDVGQKLLRKSEGLRTKSQDLKICLGRVAFDVNPGAASLRLDGHPISVEKDIHALEGEHSLEARSEGYEPQSRRFRVTGGQSNTLQVRLSPKPSVKVAVLTKPKDEAAQTASKPSLSESVAPVSSRKAWGWSIFGVGAASTVTGVLYLVAAHAAYDDANNAREQNESQFMFRGLTPAGRSLNEQLDNSQLEETYNSRKEDSERYEAAALISGSLGIVGMGVGLWLALTADDSTSSAWIVGPRGVGWSTTF